MSKKILIVDDRLDSLLTCADLLKEHGYDVSTCSQSRRALEVFGDYKPDAVLLDVMMPGKNGFELLAEIRARDRRLPVIMLSAYGDADAVVKAMKLGADHFVDKSSDPQKILIVVEKEFSRKDMELEMATLRADRDAGPAYAADIVGESPAIEWVREQVRQLADSDLAVLITGPSGVGKDLVARALHYESGRRNEPFKNLLCPGTPETLFESAIFGHERGAFTGALKRKKGIIESARRGTVLLNEIVEIPSYVQAKLLVVIETGAYNRVGGEENTLTSDARFIAATNADISQALRTKRLRDDLFFRLNQATIEIPGLTERGEDVILLAEHFVREECERTGRPEIVLSERSKEVLMEYSWPGNVRQLKNLMKSIVQAGSDDPISGYSALSARDGGLGKDQKSVKLKDIVRRRTEEVEREKITEALSRFKGSRKKSAQYLGISYRDLMYKMKKYNLREVF
jgi:DNA-binding NtrC family response regulator